MRPKKTCFESFPSRSAPMDTWLVHRQVGCKRVSQLMPPVLWVALQGGCFSVCLEVRFQALLQFSIPRGGGRAVCRHAGAAVGLQWVSSGRGL